MRRHTSWLMWVALLAGCKGSPPDQNKALVRAVAWVEEMGGKVKVDFEQPGNPVVYVDLFSKKKVTDAGLAHLKGLANLEELDLARTWVTDAGLTHLKGLNLRSLGLIRTKVTAKAVRQLEKASPRVRIQH